MDPHIPVLILSFTALTAITIVSYAILRGWRDWLALKQMAIKADDGIGAPSPAALIELAALKERVRKLEAIASGVDLLP